jgi:hypothetical protein
MFTYVYRHPIFIRMSMGVENIDLVYLHTYIPLTLYPRRGSRGISNISPRHPRFTNYTNNYNCILSYRN